MENLKSKLMKTLLMVLMLLHPPTDTLAKDQKRIEFVSMNRIPVIRGRLNGKNVYFIVDSGASFSVLDITASKKFKFEYTDSDMEAAGYGGHAVFQVVSGATVTIGLRELNVEFKGQDLRVIRNIIMANEHVDIIGIIGSDVLNDLDAVIDYSKNIMTIK